MINELNDHVPVLASFCHGCKKEGHQARNCPLNRCFHCRQWAHLSKNCPTRQQKGSVAVAAEALDVTPQIDSTDGDDNGAIEFLDAPDSEDDDWDLKYRFLITVLSWKAEDFMDSNLLIASLAPIPDKFVSNDSFFGSFFPFILEETRARLHSKAESNFFEVERFEFSVRPPKLKGEEICVKIDVTMLLSGHEFKTDLKSINSSLALLVKNGPQNLTWKHLSVLEHFLVNVEGMKGKSLPASEPIVMSVTFPINEHSMSIFRENESKGSPKWFIYFLDIATLAAVR